MGNKKGTKREHKKSNKRNKKKDKKNNNKKNKNQKQTEHLYFSPEALDNHYEKKQRELIPKTFDPSTRLTKTELVQIVSQHFLSQPLLAELNEIDVIKQFLLFIQRRRN